MIEIIQSGIALLVAACCMILLGYVAIGFVAVMTTIHSHKHPVVVHQDILYMLDIMLNGTSEEYEHLVGYKQTAAHH